MGVVQASKVDVTKELIGKMEKHVKRVLENFASDFYDHDVKEIEEYAKEAEPPKLLWSIRESGTWLIPLIPEQEERIEQIKEQYKDHRVIEYFIVDVKKGTLKKIYFYNSQ